MKEEDKLPPLERYFRILELLAGLPEGATLNELASMLALPKPTVHRLLVGLQKSMLVTVQTGHIYTLAARARRLAVVAMDSDFVQKLSNQHLRDLVEKTGETCYLARLQGLVVKTVAMDSPNAPWRGFVLPGKVMHPHATASAKAILSHAAPDVIDRALDTKLPKLTKLTLTDPEAIKMEYARVREKGYATCIGEVDDALSAVALPIQLADGHVDYALGVVGTSPRIAKLIEDGLVSHMRTITEAIGTALRKAVS